MDEEAESPYVQAVLYSEKIYGWLLSFIPNIKRPANDEKYESN